MSLIALRPSEMKLLKFCELLYDWKCEVQFLWWLLQDCVFCFCCWSACCVLCVVCIIFHCILFWNIVFYCTVFYCVWWSWSAHLLSTYLISSHAMHCHQPLHLFTVCNRLPYFITSYTPIILSYLIFSSNYSHDITVHSIVLIITYRKILQHNVPCHITSYHFITLHIVTNHITSHQTTSHHTTPHHTSYNITWRKVASNNTI